MEDEPLGFAWIGLGVRDFDKRAVGDVLTQLGFTLTAGQDQAPLDRAMRFWIDESWGQDALFFADAEGIVFRVMSTEDCGACPFYSLLRRIACGAGHKSFHQFCR